MDPYKQHLSNERRAANSRARFGEKNTEISPHPGKMMQAGKRQPFLAPKDQQVILEAG